MSERRIEELPGGGYAIVGEPIVAQPLSPERRRQLAAIRRARLTRLDAEVRPALERLRAL